MASKFSKLSKTSQNIVGSKDDVKKMTINLQSIVEGDKPVYQYIRIDNIQLNEFNDYAEEDTEQSIADLAEDIKANGLLHNIVVSYTQTGEYLLLSGERRLKAYRYLYETTKNEKYAEIYALVRKNLSKTEEMIILDAANLQTRGSMGEEKRFRKATVRFIENIQKHFGMDSSQAISLAKQYANVTGGVIEKNVLIEKDLHPDLKSLLDRGLISKTQAVEYAKLDEDMQKIIAENLVLAEHSGADMKTATSDVQRDVKSIQTSREKARAYTVQAEDIEKKISGIKATLDASDIDEDKKEKLLDDIGVLEGQLDYYKNGAEIAQKKAEDTTKSLSESKKEKKTNAEKTAEEKAMNNLQKIEKAIVAFDTKTMFNRIRALDKKTQQAIIKRVGECCDQMTDIYNRLGDKS